MSAKIVTELRKHLIREFKKIDHYSEENYLPFELESISENSIAIFNMYFDTTKYRRNFSFVKKVLRKYLKLYKDYNFYYMVANHQTQLIQDLEKLGFRFISNWNKNPNHNTKVALMKFIVR